MYLDRLLLSNFKKFNNSEFKFDKGMNIVIGQNDSGKSSLLQAIDIALNQRGNGDWRNTSEYGTLLNVQAKKYFLDNVTNKISSKMLPSIKIELFFAEDNHEIPLHDNAFYGPNNSTGKQDFGLTFTYSFDDMFTEEFDELVKNDSLDFIPFDFYKPNWQMFSGKSYTFRKNPFKSILINTDAVRGDSYKAFTNQFLATLTTLEQHSLSLKLKQHLVKFNSDISELELDSQHRLGIDQNRLLVKDTLDVFDSENNDLFVRDSGSGTENIIKTDLSMSSKQSKLVLLEEPENHLSFDLARQQIEKIEGANEEKRQVIVSTHSPLLASKLGVNQLKWLNSEKKLVSFLDISNDTRDFFLKADNIDVLQVILAHKVVLVEGSTEYIVMQDIIQATYGKTANELGIHIVSMGGNYYKRFIEISRITKNKILVITDNDAISKRITDAEIASTDYFMVKMPDNIEDFTFEVALYNQNKDFFSGEKWPHESTKETWHKYSSLDKKLVWLLDHKPDAALEYSKAFQNNEISAPEYITEGLKWLQK